MKLNYLHQKLVINRDTIVYILRKERLGLLKLNILLNDPLNI